MNDFLKQDKGHSSFRDKKWMEEVSRLIKFLLLSKTKGANYNNVAAAISKTAGSYGYLNFSSGDCKVNVDVSKGEYVLITAGVFCSSSAAGTFPQFSLFENSNQIGSVSNVRVGTFSSTGEDYQYNTSILLTNPAVGNTEYSLRWQKAAGAGTVYARFPYLNVITMRGT